MTLNDWADQDEDARERPDRPLPSGGIRPAAALGAAIGLTGAGLALAARASRPAATVAGALVATVWAYDLKLKHTFAGPAAMAAARGLDLLLGAVAAGGRPQPAVLLSAAALAAHTYAVTQVSRHETTGGSGAAPLAALATSVVIGTGVGWDSFRSLRGTGALAGPDAVGRAVSTTPEQGAIAPRSGEPVRGRSPSHAFTVLALATAYGAAAVRPYAHAVLNSSPALTQRAVRGGIGAVIPLQAVLAARAGSPLLGGAVMALLPMARRFSRTVSPT
jgi:4-hydroxybenzoate polyprenyltransferase